MLTLVNKSPSHQQYVVTFGRLAKKGSDSVCNQASRASEFRANALFLAEIEMVPGARIELATPAFSGRRSTSELPRHGGVC